MKLNNINKNIIGNTYKYSELCELFGEEVLKNTSGRFQRKRFLIVIDYIQKGHSYTITKIKEKELKRIKLNKDGKLVGKHKNQNSLDNLNKGQNYSPYKAIDDLFLAVLSSHKNKINKDINGKTYFSSFDYLVCDALEVLNRNFKWGRYRKKELYKYLKDKKMLSCKNAFGKTLDTYKMRDKKYIDLYLKDLNRKISGAINSSLSRLSKEKIVDIFDMNGYYVITKESRKLSEGIFESDLEPASCEIVKLILEARTKALLEMKLVKEDSLEGVKNKNKVLSKALSRVYKNNERVKQFNSLCCRYISELTNGDIVYFTKRVYINFNEISKDKLQANAGDLKTNINKLLQDRMISNYIKKDEKRLDIYESLNKIIADLNAKDILNELEEISLNLKNKK